MILRGQFNYVRRAALGGAFYVREQRGQLVVCAWPLKRGKPKHPTTIAQNEKFKEANLLAQYADIQQQVISRELVEGTALLPRDMLLSAMYGRLFAITFEDGFTRYSVSARGDASTALDILAQVAGSVLVRGPELWVPAGTPEVGRVLTFLGAGLAPAWQPTGAGTGSWTLVENKVLTSALALGVDHVINIPAGASQIETTLYVESTGAGTRPRIRMNGDTGTNYFRQMNGVNTTNAAIRQTVANAGAWYPFHTSQTPITVRSFIIFRFHQSPDLGRVQAVWNGYSGKQTTTNGGGTWIISPAAALATIEIASDQGAGLPIDTQIITRATFT